MVLARTSIYLPLRVTAAMFTGAAALGWVLARVGVPNAAADVADGIGAAALPKVLALWLAAATALLWFWGRPSCLGLGGGRPVDAVGSR